MNMCGLRSVGEGGAASAADLTCSVGVSYRPCAASIASALDRNTPDSRNLEFQLIQLNPEDPQHSARIQGKDYPATAKNYQQFNRLACRKVSHPKP